MKLSISRYGINAILLALLFIALVAPFTFLKPQFKKTAIEVVVIPEIKEVQVTPEQPRHSVNLPDFASIRDVKEKKRKFFAFIAPAVAKENKKLALVRKDVRRLITQLSLEQPLSVEDQKLLTSLVKKYRVNKKFSILRQLYQLERKVDVIPLALVLVQAANESAWGTSRFARIGLNFFGIWCFKEGCGMVPNGRDEGADHEVAAYKSVEQAVARYLHNINTNSAYSVFRTIRAQLREHNQPLTAEILATGLLPYSERGADYVLELTEMIRHNRDYFVISNGK